MHIQQKIYEDNSTCTYTFLKCYRHNMKPTEEADNVCEHVCCHYHYIVSIFEGTGVTSAVKMNKTAPDQYNQPGLTQAQTSTQAESVWTVCTLQCEGCQHDTAPIVLCGRAGDRDTSARCDVYDTVQCSPHLSAKTASRHTPFTQTGC